MAKLVRTAPETVHDWTDLIKNGKRANCRPSRLRHLTKAKAGSTFVGAADWLRRHGEAFPLYLESGPRPPTGFPDVRISPWYYFRQN